MKKVFIRIITVTLLAAALPAATGSAEQATAPQDYGRAVMNTASSQAGMAPVVFDHWLHRAKYTCRVCHSDIGFALKNGGTDIKAVDNANGLYCGVCHNGKMQAGDRKVFAACSADKSDTARCDRCHAQGKSVKRDYDFKTFAASLPKDGFGNGINWEKAAADGLIKPSDFIEGVSVKKPAQPIQQDFTIQPKMAGKPHILFSHRKHVVWSGCEVCHPDIFRGGKRGTTNYSMKEINEGKFCGVCHSKVSFPLTDCDRCHSQVVK